MKEYIGPYRSNEKNKKYFNKSDKKCVQNGSIDENAT